MLILKWGWVDSLYWNINVPDMKVMCLAVSIVGDVKVPNIVGARHQAHHTFLFVVGNNQVSFVSKPHASDSV